MLNIVYIVLIFIISSISIQISSGIFIMPYILYLANLKTKLSCFLLLIIGIIYSLQTDKIFFILFFFGLYYLIFYCFFKYINYTYMNIIFFSVIEQILWTLIFEKQIDYITIIFPFIFYNIFNLIFMRIHKKIEAGVIN